MICKRARAVLPLYLSRELPADQRAAIQRHLDTCAACRAELGELEAAENTARAAFQEEVNVPDSLDDRVMQAVRTLPPPRRSWLSRWFGTSNHLSPVLAGGLALLLVAGGWQWGRGSRPVASAPPAMELTTLGAAHERLAANPGDEIRSPSRADLSARISARVRFPVTAIDLSPEATQLVGGGVTEVQGANVACLHYQWNGSRVTLFQMDASRLPPPGLREFPHQVESYSAERQEGISYVAWRSGPIGCVLVSREMPMHRLFQLACHACERQSQHAESETNAALRRTSSQG